MKAHRGKLLVAVAISVLSAFAVYVSTQKFFVDRVGSTMERAIANPLLDIHESHEFEKQYLRQHFPGAEFHQHATVEGMTPDTAYSMHELTFKSKKRELWFDVTPSFREVIKDM